MRILITGDSGLIGSHLADALYRDHTIFGLSRSTRNQNNKVTRFNVDLTNAKQVDEAIKFIKPELVYHLAANAAEGRSQTQPISITQNNIGIFMNVLIPSIKYGMKRFVFTSSNAVYGEIKTPYKETDLPKPQDIYAINKLASEESLKLLASYYNFEYVIVRPHNVYGERQYMNDNKRNVVVVLMNQLMRGEAVSLYGNGTKKRNFSYVKDVAKVIHDCGFYDVAGQTINVGSDFYMSINELYEHIQKISGIKRKPNYVEERKLDVHTAVPSHELQNSLFIYNETNIYAGLENTWKWCKKQGAQEYDKEVNEL